MVGITRLPSLSRWTSRKPSSSWSTSTNAYGTRCSPKNCFALVQSWHHVVPYMRIVASRATSDFTLTYNLRAAEVVPRAGAARDRATRLHHAAEALAAVWPDDDLLIDRLRAQYAPASRFDDRGSVSDRRAYSEGA